MTSWQIGWGQGERACKRFQRKGGKNANIQQKCIFEKTVVSQFDSQGKFRFCIYFESEAFMHDLPMESMWGTRERRDKSIPEVFVLSRGNLVAAVY